MLWIVVLLYVAGGILALAAAVVIVYRISWMKVWEAGTAIETDLAKLLLRHARAQADAAPADDRAAQQRLHRAELDASFLERSIPARRSWLLQSLAPDEIRELVEDALEVGRDPVWALMRREFTMPIVFGLLGVSLSTGASIWSLWL